MIDRITKKMAGKKMVILLTDSLTLEVETFEVDAEHLEFFLKQLKTTHNLKQKEMEMIMPGGIRMQISDSFTRYSLMQEDQKSILNWKIEAKPQPSFTFQVGDK